MTITGLQGLQQIRDDAEQLPPLHDTPQVRDDLPQLGDDDGGPGRAALDRAAFLVWRR